MIEQNEEAFPPPWMYARGSSVSVRIENCKIEKPETLQSGIWLEFSPLEERDV